MSVVFANVTNKFIECEASDSTQAKTGRLSTLMQSFVRHLFIRARYLAPEVVLEAGIRIHSVPTDQNLR